MGSEKLTLNWVRDESTVHWVSSYFTYKELSSQLIHNFKLLRHFPFYLYWTDNREYRIGQYVLVDDKSWQECVCDNLYSTVNYIEIQKPLLVVMYNK